MALFSVSACIGFEELFRQFILEQLRDTALADGGASPRKHSRKRSEKKEALTRDFTCTCESTTAELIFLSTSVIQPILKMHDAALIE